MLLSTCEVNNLGKEFNFKSLNGKNVLISGGSGMLGSYLSEAILRTMELQGLSLSNLTITSLSGDFSNVSSLMRFPKIVLVKTDFKEKLEFADFDHIIHAASPSNSTKIESRESLEFSNRKAISALAKRGTESITFISTGEIYGDCDLPAKESSSIDVMAFKGRPDYPLAKLSGENAVREIGKDLEAKINIIRLFHTFGPGLRADDGRSFADFLYRVANGKLPLLKSDGSQIRSFMYSLDSIRGILTCFFAAERELVCNVGSDIPMSIRDFASLVSKTGGLGGEILAEEAPTYTHSPFKRLIPSTSLLRSLGWAPKIPIEIGIRQSLDWINQKTS